MLTMNDALDRLGAKFCTACAAKLPVVGGQCPACGALPAVTRTELADALSEPGRSPRPRLMNCGPVQHVTGSR